LDSLRCDVLIQQLQGDPGNHNSAIACIYGQVSKLAFEVAGCRVIQKAFESADASDREALVAEMHGHVREAVLSPHANFVIQKIVETMPAALASFVAEELIGIGAEVARHRYGCRIICRLIEHQDQCSRSSATQTLIDELFGDARLLCLHSFARHVIGSLLEHGTAEQRHRMAETLHGIVGSYARKRSASYIVEGALSFCDPHDKEALASELLADSARFVDLATHDAGCHVVRALLRLDSERSDGQVRRAKCILQDASGRLQESRYGQRLLDEFKLHESMPN
jgi:pumilio RNA-binding family